MKKLYEENDIRRIAHAIRKKTGNADLMKVADIPDAISHIQASVESDRYSQTSNVDENGVWHRPEEWDDIESISIEEDKSELYLLYANHLNGHSFCRLRVYGTGTIKWARGHVVNGEFVNSTADATVASGGYIAIDLEQLEDDYSVIRITATTSITQCLPSAWNGTNAAYAMQFNTMLMRYGRMPKGTNIVTATYYLESDNVMDFAKNNSGVALTMASAYQYCVNLKRWRHTGWNIAGNTTASLSYFLGYCGALTDVDNLNFDGWVSSKTTNISYMLYICSSLGKPLSVKNWDLSSITTMTYAFYSCYLLPGIYGCETWNAAPKCTTVSYMFNYCYGINNDLDLSGMSLGNGTANFTAMTSAFHYCGAKSININGWNLSKVTSMTSCFAYMPSCSRIIMDNITPPSALTAAATLFIGSRVLEEVILDSWDFSHCTSFTTGPFYQTFYGCFHLKKVVFKDCLFQTTSASDSSSAYGNYCYSNYNIRYIDVSDADFSIFSSTYMHSRAFYGMSCCVDFFPPKNITKNFSLSGCNMLSHDSLLRVFNNLVPPDEGVARTLTIGSINKAKMTAEELAIATDKGWTIA